MGDTAHMRRRFAGFQSDSVEVISILIKTCAGNLAGFNQEPQGIWLRQDPGRGACRPSLSIESPGGGMVHTHHDSAIGPQMRPAVYTTLMKAGEGESGCGGSDLDFVQLVGHVVVGHRDSEGGFGARVQEDALLHQAPP